MNYKKIEVINPDGTSKQHIIIERDDGSFVSFPADPENPVYQQFLEEKDK